MTLSEFGVATVFEARDEFSVLVADDFAIQDAYEGRLIVLFG